MGHIPQFPLCLCSCVAHHSEKITVSAKEQITLFLSTWLLDYSI